MNKKRISSNLTRGEFIRTTAAGTVALMAGTALPLRAARKDIPIGVQLWSVRQTAAADLPGTLAGIKKIGYDGVEFAGYYNKKAKEVRKLLDDNGLKALGSHLQLQTFADEAIDETIEFSNVLGLKYLAVPMMWGVDTLDAWKKAADNFNGIAEKLKPHGMEIGFHNHTGEFKPVDDVVPLEYFFSNTSDDVFMQLDIGHCIKVADPLYYLKKFPGRARSVHIKDWNPETKSNIPGEGDVKWPETIELCETVAGTEVYIIEEESGSFKDLEGIDKMLKGLKKFLV
ncbi:MAG: sugar phosphate isomerase/epimerase [Fidelibacterota bacterium]|nr:MAG: sugar phosphate isomerase/epimerase [Candidatus Neomarinimicrobiota bacterium]